MHFKCGGKGLEKKKIYVFSVLFFSSSCSFLFLLFSVFVFYFSFYLAVCCFYFCCCFYFLFCYICFVLFYCFYIYKIKKLRFWGCCFMMFC